MKKYLEQLLKYGSIVDFNVDAAGGTVSDAGAVSTGTDGTTVDTVENLESSTENTEDTGDDSKDAEDASSDTSDTTDDTSDTTVSDTSSVDDRIAALTNQISTLTNTLSSSPDSSDDEGGTDDFSSLEHEDLVAMMADDPKNFIQTLTSAIRESVSKDVRQESATSDYNSKVENTIDQYADDNPTFEKMWDEGKLQSYMEKNPGHNAISAHMVITMEQRVTDAKKEGAETAAKNFSTKQNNQVLNSGPSISPDQRDAALKNPGKFGGRSAVLAARAGIT